LPQKSIASSKVTVFVGCNLPLDGVFYGVHLALLMIVVPGLGILKFIAATTLLSVSDSFDFTSNTTVQWERAGTFR
jgi:hypothetical protein